MDIGVQILISGLEPDPSETCAQINDALKKIAVAAEGHAFRLAVHVQMSGAKIDAKFRAGEGQADGLAVRGGNSRGRAANRAGAVQIRAACLQAEVSAIAAHEIELVAGEKIGERRLGCDGVVERIRPAVVHDGA